MIDYASFKETVCLFVTMFINFQIKEVKKEPNIKNNIICSFEIDLSNDTRGCKIIISDEDNTYRSSFKIFNDEFIDSEINKFYNYLYDNDINEIESYYNRFLRIIIDNV